MQGKWTTAVCTALALSAALWTPGAAAQEWINLFDGETLFGWQPLGDGEWEVDGGAISCKKGSGGWLATTSSFADFELVAKLKVSKRRDAVEKAQKIGIL